MEICPWQDALGSFSWQNIPGQDWGKAPGLEGRSFLAGSNGFAVKFARLRLGSPRNLEPGGPRQREKTPFSAFALVIWAKLTLQA